MKEKDAIKKVMKSHAAPETIELLMALDGEAKDDFTLCITDKVNEKFVAWIKAGRPDVPEME